MSAYIMPPVQSIREAFAEASSFLGGLGVGEPQRSAQLLLEYVLGLSGAAYYIALADPFPPDKRELWERAVTRRGSGEPVQYITGEQEFYGRVFEVTPDVLIPRPETELLVEAVLRYAAELWPEGMVNGADVEAVVDAGEAKGRTGTDRPGANWPVGAVPPGGNRLGEGQTDESGPDVGVGHAGEWEKEAGLGSAYELETRHANGSGTNSDDADEPEDKDGAGMSGMDGNGSCGCGSPAKRGGARRLTAVDIGAGSGAISVTLAAEAPAWRVLAGDISPAALAVAGRNAERLGAAVELRLGDLLEPFRGLETDILVSNPPYIPGGDIAGLQREVRDHEPRTALDGGADGLDPYRRMMEQLQLLPAPPRLVGFELGLGQAEQVAALLAAAGHWNEIVTVPDLAGIPRHVLGIAR